MKILYFAWIRQRIGHGEETIYEADGLKTVADVIEHLAAKGEGYASAFEDLSILKIAINQEFAELSSQVSPGDEIAFFPPVTGG